MQTICISKAYNKNSHTFCVCVAGWCVCVCACTHTEVQLTNITTFFTVSVMILEPQKPVWQICASTWQILIKTQMLQ